MAWVTPITDRVLSDVTSPTPGGKGYFNVADWERIDGNVDEIKAILDAADYLDIPLNILVTPDITTIPDVDDINDFIENIELLRQSACLPIGLGLVALKYDYIGGANYEAPDYEDVNDWENNLLIMYESIALAIDYQVHCGVAAVGQSRLWQNKFR
jgi:hypothetical protein